MDDPSEESEPKGASRPEITAVRDLPSALDRWDEIGARVVGRTLAVFLDYDGTLTPIVERPDDARLSPETRRILERVATRYAVALVSGRDLADLRRHVDLDGLFYVGSHGFDMAGPGGIAEQRAVEFLPELDAAEEDLRRMLAQIAGAHLERKRFAIAVHFRQVDGDRIPEIETVVDRVVTAHPGLRMTHGKKIMELRPNVDWDKGRALLWLLEVMGIRRQDALPLYLGDDVTDEDAFRAIRDWGVGIVVRGEDDYRSTAARFSLADSQEVRVFLDRLTSGAVDVRVGN